MIATAIEVPPGNYIRLKATFIKASTGVLTSPTAATAVLIMPDGTTTTETLAELSTGVMYIDIQIAANATPGLGVFRPSGTGAVVATADDVQFHVLKKKQPTSYDE